MRACELGLALHQHRAGLQHAGFARFIGKHGDHIACLYGRAAAHLEFRNGAVGAGHQHHLLVGLGAARQHEIARARLDPHFGDGDAERFRLRRLGRLHRGAALRRLMRKQMPGRDPGDSGDHQADCGKACGFHDLGPVPIVVLRYRIGEKVFHHAQHERHHGFGVE